MNKKRVLIFVLFVFITTTSAMPLYALQIDDSSVADNGSYDILYDSGWNLIWQDEFNGYGKPNAQYWSSVNQNRHPNSNGPDVYWLANQVALNGRGQLSIKMNRIPNRNNDSDAYDFATGMIRTKNKFEKRFGRFEVRCKLPKKSGWWVAFWMMCDQVANVNGNGKDGTEIDILEAFGWNNHVHHALHWDGYTSHHKSASHTSYITDHNAYHTYTLIWTPTEYRYYVDGQLSWVTDKGGVSQVPEYLKLSGEASTKGWLATSVWAKDPTYVDYPDEFLVDYVRVYDYDFGVAPIPKKHIVFVPKRLTSTKDVYNLGEQVTWHAEVEGEDIQYQYYLTRNSVNLDVTDYSPDPYYSFTPHEPGYYTLLAYARYGRTVKQVGQKRVKVLGEPLKLNSIEVQADAAKITCHVNAQGDNLIYSYYILRNNQLQKYIPYGKRQSVSVYPQSGDHYRFLVYVQDEYGNTVSDFSKTVRFD